MAVKRYRHLIENNNNKDKVVICHESERPSILELLTDDYKERQPPTERDYRWDLFGVRLKESETDLQKEMHRANETFNKALAELRRANKATTEEVTVHTQPLYQQALYANTN